MESKIIIKKIKQLFKKEYVKLLFFQFPSFLLYWRLVFHFYEQDEWWGLGRVFREGYYRAIDQGVVNSLLFGAGRPLTGLINTYFFQTYKFNTIPLALFSIILHGLTIYLVYKLLTRINPKGKINLIASIFFGVNVIASQAVTWFSSFAVPLSTLFLLLSMLGYMDFVAQEKQKYLILSYFLFYLSFITKEINILFSGFFIVFFFLYKNKNLKENLKYNFPYIFITILALVRYVSTYYLNIEKKGLFISKDSQGIVGIFKNALDISTVSFSQVFTVPKSMYVFSGRISEVLLGENRGDLFNQTVVSWYVALFFSITLFISLFFLVRKRKMGSKNLALGLLVYLLAILPYAVIQRGGTSYVESRYYYLPLVGVSIILAGVDIGVNKYLKKAALGVVVFYFLTQYSSINSSLTAKIEISSVRKDIVNELRKIDLLGVKTNIFFSENEKDYIFKGQKLPFQQGVGYTLSVIYYEQGVVPNKMFEKKDLWGIGSQGTITEDGYKFGYYYDEDLLSETLTTLDEDYNLVRINYSDGNLVVQKGETKR